MNAMASFLAGVAVSSTLLAQSISIVPRPASVDTLSGRFLLAKSTVILAPSTPRGVAAIGDQCAEGIRAYTGLALRVRKGTIPRKPKDAIVLEVFRKDTTIGPEGYVLTVTPGSIRIRACTEAGLFYGVQSLLQLVPIAQPGKRAKLSIPAVRIADQPRFPWRGMHLDVSRHFFPKGFIKKYIDMLAMHKMNVFHWHLTDDQGWRIEIKKYPKLTEVSAWRVDREDMEWNQREAQKPGEKATYGGFYTQNDIREIVQYAASRQITIVPEIEMPAHTKAVLAAYPQLSCSGGPFTVPPGGYWPITDIYCAGNDSTFEFLQDVLTEVIGLFPGKYIHIGGDEADKTEWRKCPKCQARIKAEKLNGEGELQSYFVKRIENFLISKNRRLIGWDEILEGGLAPEATVMSWRGVDGGIAAARQNHHVIMTPTSNCYFDYYQGPPEVEPLAIGGYLPLSAVYAFEPVPDSLTPEQAGYVLGGQGNIWTEYIPVPEDVEYMALPRMAAMAEVTWTPKPLRQWDDFARRVESLMKRYDRRGLRYAKSTYAVNFAVAVDTVKRTAAISLSTEMPGTEVRYSLDGSVPTADASLYSAPLRIDRSMTIRAGAFKEGKLLDTLTERRLDLHNAAFRPVRLKNRYDRYDGGGEGALTDALRGSTWYADGRWQGYRQVDLEAVIDLQETMPVNKISASFLQNTQHWIFLPTSVEYLVSMNDSAYARVAQFTAEIPTSPQPVVVRDFKQDTPGTRARYIMVRAKNVGVCPDWHPGKGQPAWLFVDEVTVE